MLRCPLPAALNEILDRLTHASQSNHQPLHAHNPCCRDVGLSAVRACVLRSPFGRELQLIYDAHPKHAKAQLLILSIAPKQQLPVVNINAIHGM